MAAIARVVVGGGVGGGGNGGHGISVLWLGMCRKHEVLESQRVPG